LKVYFAVLFIFSMVRNDENDEAQTGKTSIKDALFVFYNL